MRNNAHNALQVYCREIMRITSEKVEYYEGICDSISPI